MNRLVKAEWYRITHSRNMFRNIILGALLLGVFPICASIGHFNEDLASVLEGSGAFTSFIFLMALPPAYSLISGKVYDRGKLAYYEVMAGNRIRNIVGSKLLSTGMLFLGLSTLSLSAFYAVVGLVNGSGGLDALPWRFLLLIVLLAHTIFCSILITIAFGRPGAAICYIRFIIFDTAALPFLTWLAGSVCGFNSLALHIAHMSIMNRLMMLIADPVDTMLVLHTILGCLFELLLWYAVIYSRMKRKKFK